MIDLTKRFVNITLLNGKKKRIDLDDIYSVENESTNETVITFKNPVYGDGLESFKEPFSIISEAHKAWLKEKSN